MDGTARRRSSRVDRTDRQCARLSTGDRESLDAAAGAGSQSGRARLSLDALVSCLRKQLDGYEPVGWLPSSPMRNDEIYVVGRDGGEPQVLWIDAGTGTVYGLPTDPAQTFTGWLLELHYSQLGGHTGVFVAGTLAVMLCLLGITGL